MAQGTGEPRGGRKQTRIHNPAPPIPPPGKQKEKKVAGKKSTSSGRRSNGAQSKGGAKKTPPKTNGAKAGGAKKAPPTKGGAKKGGAKRHKNGQGVRILNPKDLVKRIPALPGGLTVTSLMAAGGGAIVTQVLNNAISLGAPGSWPELLKQIGLVALVAKLWPASLDKKSATAGAAAVPVVSLVNKLAPNFITRLQSYVPKFGQTSAPAPTNTAGAGGGAQGVNGLVDVNDRLLFGNVGASDFSDRKQGVNGLVSTTLGPPRSAPLYARTTQLQQQQ